MSRSLVSKTWMLFLHSRYQDLQYPRHWLTMQMSSSHELNLVTGSSTSRLLQKRFLHGTLH